MTRPWAAPCPAKASTTCREGSAETKIHTQAPFHSSRSAVMAGGSYGVKSASAAGDPPGGGGAALHPGG